MHFKCIFTILTLSLLSQLAPHAASSRILAVYSFPGKSHFMMHTTLVRELINRGHEVTMITAFTMKPQNFGSNYTEILIEPVYDFWKDIQHTFFSKNLFEMTSMDVTDFLTMLNLFGISTTEYALQQPKVQELINSTHSQRFDLLLAEQFYQEAFLAFAYTFNIPVVTSSTLGYENHMSQMMGVITPWSFVPHGFLPFTDKMNFMERLQNSYYSLYEDMNREFRYFPAMDGLVQKYFGHLQVPIPSVSRMEKNISVMLLNSYAPLTSQRPNADGMIAVGGMHIYPPKKLPNDMQTFLDDAVDGAIYFSLGSNVQSKDMPADKLKIFMDVFASMKQRVLWKFEDEAIKNLPSNIMVKKWLPQSDILAHPNVKVFITHGGMFGTQEGVHYGKPMLGMPVYCDQHLNMNRAVKSGYAISLHFQSITHEILKQSLHELIYNPMYKENIQRVSEIFRDRPMNARDTAIYWIEYVIRHKGAKHMRSAGLDLKWYQFYLLDVLALVLFVVLLAVILLVLGVRFLLCRNREMSSKQKRH